MLLLAFVNESIAKEREAGNEENTCPVIVKDEHWDIHIRYTIYKSIFTHTDYSVLHD